MNRFLVVFFMFFSALVNAKPIISFNGFKWGTNLTEIRKAHKAHQELGVERPFFMGFLLYDFTHLKNSERAEFLGDYPLESKTFYFHAGCEKTDECLLNSGTYTLANPSSVDVNELINKYKGIYNYIGATREKYNGESFDLHATQVIIKRYIFQGNYGGAVLIEVDHKSRITMGEIGKASVSKINIRYLNRDRGVPYVEEYNKLLKNTESIKKVNDF